MLSKMRIENRKPKSKIQSGTLLKIEMAHVNYILSQQHESYKNKLLQLTLFRLKKFIYLIRNLYISIEGRHTIAIT